MMATKTSATSAIAVGTILQNMAKPRHSYNYNYQNQDPDSNNNSNDEKNLPIPNRSLRRYDYKAFEGLAFPDIVNNEPAFLTARHVWKMHPGLLMNLLKARGHKIVRDSILFVHQLPDSRLGIGTEEDLNTQRGKYCRRVILSGGPY